MKRCFVLKNTLRVARESYGLTQAQLGAEIGVSKNTISSIELGTFYPTAYTAALLCRFFKCSFHTLFYLEEEEK